MRRDIAAASAIVFAALCAVGCGKKDDAAKIESDADILSRTLEGSEPIEGTEEKYVSLSEWNGTWTNFADYCRDDDLEDAWREIADRFNVDEGELKDTFEKICYVTDDLLEFRIEDGVVSAYDAEGDEIFSHSYSLVGLFDGDSAKTVIEGERSYLFKADEEAGRYNYLCMMPICHMESGDDGAETPDHFHFNYGCDAERATDRSGIPTMLQGGISEADKNSMLLQFFFGSAQE